MLLQVLAQTMDYQKETQLILLRALALVLQLQMVGQQQIQELHLQINTYG